jgi:carboxypeptidase family protein
MRTWYAGAALAVALMGAVAFTKPENAPIEGRVMDLVGDAVQRAHVRVVDETTGATATTLTELNGRFWIPNLDARHTYAIDVRCIGFVPWHVNGVHPTTAGAAVGAVTMEPIPPLHATMSVAQRF